MFLRNHQKLIMVCSLFMKIIRFLSLGILGKFPVEEQTV